MSALFEGLKVLDLSSVLAGPSAATFFAELGADVLKIENPKSGGDVTRSWKLSNELPDQKTSAYFSSVNYGKRYLWLDIKQHREKLDGHLRWADVVIANFKRGDYAKFKLTNDDVFALNEKVIYARITGFSSNENRVAYDSVLQAETGFMRMNGTQESGPVKMPVALIDVLAAHQLKEGILCALIQKERTGKGAVVECSLEKAGLASLVNQASNYLMTGQVPQPSGSLHPNIAPYGEIVTCSDDKKIVLAVGSDKQFRALCCITNNESLYTDERFLYNQLRVMNRKALLTILQKSFATKTRDEWMQLLILHDIPAGAIKSLDEVLESDLAKAMIMEEEIEGIATKRMASVAFTITRR